MSAQPVPQDKINRVVNAYNRLGSVPKVARELGIGESSATRYLVVCRHRS
jgi:hypothetical protein